MSGTAPSGAPLLDISQLNFDTFHRLFQLNTLLKQLGTTPGQLLLDVGGFPCYMARAFPQWHIVTTDMYENGHAPYVKSSGAALPFRDKTFDVTFACDVLEHVPQQFRDAFLKELVRVSKRAVIVAGPYATAGVAAAEAIVAGLLPSSSPAQAWLAEHAQCGLPSLLQTLDSLGAGAAAHQATALQTAGLPVDSLFEWMAFFASQAAGEHRFDWARLVTSFMQSHNRLQILLDENGAPAGTLPGSFQPDTAISKSGTQVPYRHAVIAALEPDVCDRLLQMKAAAGTVPVSGTAPAVAVETAVTDLGNLMQGLFSSISAAPSAEKDGEDGAGAGHGRTVELEEYIRRLETMLAARPPAETTNGQKDSAPAEIRSHQQGRVRRALKILLKG